MKHIILSTTVEEVYKKFEPDEQRPDIRSEEFRDAVIDMIVDQNLIEVLTDGIDVVAVVEDERV